MNANSLSVRVYSTTNKSRFPRAKLWRRVDDLMMELDAWSTGYGHSLEGLESPMLENAIRERMMKIDHLWHLLEQARAYLSGPW